MKKITLIGILILVNQLIFSQEDSRILEIRNDFKLWQPIIEQELKNGNCHYLYVWGNRYENEKWTNEKLETDSLILCISVIELGEDELGKFVYVEYFSISGDWFIMSENYYDKNDKLYFVFWKMNTFQTLEGGGLSVEKRLYFDKNGENIRSLKDIYKMNTKDKVDSDFSDREVEYKLDYKELDFNK